jgi:hypothetical protein
VPKRAVLLERVEGALNPEDARFVLERFTTPAHWADAGTEYLRIERVGSWAHAWAYSGRRREQCASDYAATLADIASETLQSTSCAQDARDELKTRMGYTLRTPSEAWR